VVAFQGCTLVAATIWSFKRQISFATITRGTKEATAVVTGHKQDDHQHEGDQQHKTGNEADGHDGATFLTSPSVVEAAPVDVLGTRATGALPVRI
jgi:hypothetical protein